MKLPTPATYEKLKRLLELGFTVETIDKIDDVTFSYHPESIEDLERGSTWDREEITAILSPFDTAHRFEVGDKAWWEEKIWEIIERPSDTEYRLNNGVVAYHFDLLPVFEEEETKITIEPAKGYMGGGVRFEEEEVEIGPMFHKFTKYEAPKQITIDGEIYNLIKADD